MLGLKNNSMKIFEDENTYIGKVDNKYGVRVKAGKYWHGKVYENIDEQDAFRIAEKLKIKYKTL